MIRFIAPERDDQDKWSHTHWYITPGLGYANRFSKNFEIGLELSGGVSEAIFPNLDPTEPRGSLNLLGSAAVKISLDPSYNMNIDISPGVKYLHSLSPLERFNGFVYSIGFSANYRFGEDPDAPQAIIRSIKISELQFPPLFAAMQSYYSKNPFGRVTITNVEQFPIFDLVVSFFQAGFMDTPTKLATIPRLESGESRIVDISASFSEEIFTTVGIVPLTGEIIAEYNSRNRPAKQSFSISYDLYDKTALTWDDDQKVGAFITSADSALRNYTSFVRQAAKDYVLDSFSESLQVAMQIFYGLKEIGCIYQIDPTSPFTQVQENPMLVDSINLPRNTLKNLTGDCDDLTVLYCALLETVGIESAYITVPGHIYAAFNTKVPSRSYQKVHPEKNMTLNINGELWVPVEITMIGTHDFLSAWRKGIEQFMVLESTPEKRVITFTAQAQDLYRPVGLRETDLGLQYGNQKQIVAFFKDAMDRLVDQILDNYTQLAQEANSKEGFNRLGIVCAQYRRYAQAQKAFNTALSLDRNYLSPQINLGNVFFMKQEYQNALRVYHEAEQILASGGQTDSSLYLAVLLNISRAYYELENYGKASEYFQMVAEQDPALVEEYAYLRSAKEGERAADVSSSAMIIFAGEEDL
ncbi:MAG: tetratricopeptide repeat protein [Spirochaetaceae bacterium]|nr:MAG: tetratricopeptide repeat protein [Spirochaetaceae bacterium]